MLLLWLVRLSVWPDIWVGTSISWNLIGWLDPVLCSATADLSSLYRRWCRSCPLYLVSVVQSVCPVYTFPYLHGILQTPETFSPRASFWSCYVGTVLSRDVWTVFMLNFPSNLLILCDVDCWNGKEVTSTGYFFFLFSFVSYSWLCWWLQHCTHSVSHIVLARLRSVLLMDDGVTLHGGRGLYEWASCILNVPVSLLVCGWYLCNLATWNRRTTKVSSAC
jgi:hypothetical protein